MNLLEKLVLHMLALSSRALGGTYLRLMGIHYGRGLIMYGLPIVSRFRGSTIRIGNRAVLCSTSLPTALGVNHPVVLRTLAPGAKILIGDDVGISGGSIVAEKRIEIQPRTMIGANVTIMDTDFHDMSAFNRRYAGLAEPSSADEVLIGENVFLGANVTILKGVRIGSNSAIGAASVVTRDIPSNVIAAGNPCHILRSLDLT